jgi:protein-ribulosamine 3-kinase
MEKEILKHVAENYYSQFGERIAIKSSHALGGGCINHALRLETNIGMLFLKWNTGGPPDPFVREAESLNELQKPGFGYHEELSLR